MFIEEQAHRIFDTVSISQVCGSDKELHCIERNLSLDHVTQRGYISTHIYAGKNY